MDPTATWKMVCEALQDMQTDPENKDTRAHAVDLLEVLARWLRMGGFPPTLEEERDLYWNHLTGSMQSYESPRTRAAPDCRGTPPQAVFPCHTVWDVDDPLAQPHCGHRT